MKFRFISSGQAVIDGVDFSQVLRGNSLKPFAPVNITGTRDAAGNLIIGWTRRTRVGGGMRPSTDVALGEESEVYDIEIYNGSTLLRSVSVSPSVAIPVFWQNVGLNPVTPAADGTILQTGVDITSTLRSLQQINGDFTFEATIDNTVRLGSVQTDGIVEILPLTSFAWGSGVIPGYTHNDGGIDYIENNHVAETTIFDLVTGDRIMIELVGLTFKYYVNYAGPQSQPYYTSARTSIPFPLVVQADLIGTTATSPIVLDNVTKPTLRLKTPSYFYTTAQQTSDFGSPQSSVKVIIYQRSAIIGRGFPAQATI